MTKEPNLTGDEPELDLDAFEALAEYVARVFERRDGVGRGHAHVHAIDMDKASDLGRDAADLVAEVRRLRAMRVSVDALAVFLKTKDVAYFAPMLKPMLAMIQSGEAGNHVLLNFVSHRGESWDLVLQRQTGTTPLDKAEAEVRRLHAALSEAVVWADGAASVIEAVIEVDPEEGADEREKIAGWRELLAAISPRVSNGDELPAEPETQTETQTENENENENE